MSVDEENHRDSDDSESGLKREDRNESEDPDYRASETESTKSEESKDEKLFIRCVRSIRKKFTARKLIGCIYVYRGAGFISTSMKCRITEKEYLNNAIGATVSDDSNEEMSGNYRKAVTMTDSLLDSMERRAMKWETVDFSSDVTISRGTKVSIAGPLLGIVGYTLSLELHATVQSLIDSRRRFLAQKDPSSGRFGSFTRSLSKSFSLRGKGESGKDSSSSPRENSSYQSFNQLDSKGTEATPNNSNTTNSDPQQLINPVETQSSTTSSDPESHIMI